MSDLQIDMLRRKGGLTARQDMAPPTTIRMPPALRDQLKSRAKANFRSLSMEICARLESSMVGESLNEHGSIVRVLPPQGK